MLTSSSMTKLSKRLPLVILPSLGPFPANVWCSVSVTPSKPLEALAPAILHDGFD